MSVIGFQHYPIEQPGSRRLRGNRRHAANSGTQNLNTLIIGQQLAAARSPPAARDLHGRDRHEQQGRRRFHAGKMVDRYRQTDNFGTVYLLPLADDGAGVAATGTIVFTGPATAAGTLPIYIGEEIVNVGVTSGMASTAIATAVGAAINANPYLPVTWRRCPTSTVTLTAKNKGLAGNDIQINIAYGGAPAGKSVPAGVTATITAMAWRDKPGSDHAAAQPGRHAVRLHHLPLQRHHVVERDADFPGPEHRPVVLEPHDLGPVLWCIPGHAGRVHDAAGCAQRPEHVHHAVQRLDHPVLALGGGCWRRGGRQHQSRSGGSDPVCPDPRRRPADCQRFVFSDRQTLLSTGGSTFLSAPTARSALSGW
jgi:hypothetical protein